MVLYLKVLASQLTNLETLLRWLGKGKPEVLRGRGNSVYLAYIPPYHLTQEHRDAIEAIAEIVSEDEARGEDLIPSRPPWWQT